MRTWLAIPLLVAVLVVAPLEPRAGDDMAPPAETWLTWVIGGPLALRPPPSSLTPAECDELRALAARRDAATRDAIAYWDTGPPSYRWNETAVAEALAHHQYTHVAARGLALLHVALDDAMVVAWDAKAAYRRPSPGTVDPDLTTAVVTPSHPSYPGEHAVAAGAAAEVLGYLYKERAAVFAERAREAARSRMLAGVNYASDVQAGLDLGREVARRVIVRARADRSEAAWTGRVPAGAGKWTGANPVLPQAAGWRPWVLASADELRPPPPPSHDSPEMAAELEEVRRFRRTPKSNADALFWEHAAGGARSFQFWNQVLDRKILEYRFAEDPPRAARAYALLNVAFYDAAVACWDAKYAYWAIRPGQLDPTITPLFATPQHPSYPSGHSCLSAAAASVLGHLFPRDRAVFDALATEASESRLWAGIHFRSDLAAGRALGRAVAERVVARARMR